MKANISSVLSQVRANIECDTSSATEPKTLGDPNCPQCAGAGYVRFDVPFGHEKFGKLESCVFYIIKGAHLGEKLLSKRSPPHSVFSVR